ncbi:YceI family protein [Kribbella sp. NPDC049227]|uniref:YceI family protein n=1 Tax=Kribbella sp. NPDC049227 TaxID=3364113 RepID=UPI0037163AD3
MPNPPGYRPGVWKVDAESSRIEFSIHQLATQARGQFTNYDVAGVATEDIAGSSVTAMIDLTSIDTGNPTRDKHLRGRGFLNVRGYPAMRYRSTGVRHTADGLVVDGELELHGTTRAVQLRVELDRFTTDTAGNWRASLSAGGQISRREFGLGIPMAAGSRSRTRSRSGSEWRPSSRAEGLGYGDGDGDGWRESTARFSSSQ